MNTSSEQLNTLQLEHKLELERLKNEHLEKQFKDQKSLIEDHQQQIKQLDLLHKSSLAIETSLTKANEMVLSQEVY